MNNRLVSADEAPCCMDDVDVLMLANADLVGEGEWTGTPPTTSPAPLPIYPQPHHLVAHA